MRKLFIVLNCYDCPNVRIWPNHPPHTTFYIWTCAAANRQIATCAQGAQPGDFPDFCPLYTAEEGMYADAT